MLKTIQDRKPSDIFIDKESNKAILIVGGKRLSLDLKEEIRTKQFARLIENMDEFEQRVDKGNLDGYHFNWQPKEELVEEKEEEIIQPTLQEEVAEEEEEEELSLLDAVHKIIQEESVLELVASSTGTVVKDGKVSGKTIINPLEVKAMYDEYSQEETNAVGMIPKGFNINGVEYSSLMWKVGDDISIKFSRKINDLSDVVMVMPTEMKYRLEKIDNGLIITTIDPMIKMEHIIPMMEHVDKDFKSIACSVGDKNLLVTDLPTHASLSNLEKLKYTHYKYILVSGVETTAELTSILDLMYSGKTIILGFDNDSVYSNLIYLLSLFGGEGFNNNKLLMSTIGFIHPVLKIVDNELSLEDTECFTLSSSKVKSIVDGDLSKERINSLIERPGKVYKLGSKGEVFLTQEDEVRGLLKKAVEVGASDVHLAVGTSPMFRVEGKIVAIDKDLRLKPEVLDHITSLLVTSEFQKMKLEKDNEIYLPYSLYGVGRFRIQISTQRGTRSIVIRHTASVIPSAKDIRLPQQIIDVVTNNPKGIVIITGPTGSGKSTTSAVLIDELKKSGSYAITSLADPIEFLHSHGTGIVTQREIPSDVKNFDNGLNAAFRSDPDIIEIAEMRTNESVHAAMRFGNSGHLVITTYHTSSVKATFDALLNRVEPERQGELISTLSQNLILIVNQILVEGKNGKRVPIFEYLIPNRNIRRYIQENKLSLIESEMKSSARADKSVATWADYELIEAYERGEITQDVLNKYLVEKDAPNHFHGEL